jgi:hypothetical protein
MFVLIKLPAKKKSENTFEITNSSTHAQCSLSSLNDMRSSQDVQEKTRFKKSQ